MVRIEVLLCFVVVCITLTVTPAAVAQTRSDSPAIDPFDPPSWAKSVTAAQAERQKMVRALIEIAKDTDRTVQHREMAIKQLAELRDPLAVSFLIDNITMKLPGLVLRGGFGALLREQSCFFALLSETCKNDWNIAREIMATLEKEKSPEEMLNLMVAFKKILGANLALAIVEVELGKRPSDGRKARLEYFKKNIRE